jgi:hypothetical protein
MNLFPISFKNTDPKLWKQGFAKRTGISDKPTYLNWCREHRFGWIRQLVRTQRPKLVICTGITWRDDFALAFDAGEHGLSKGEAGGKEFLHFLTNGGRTLVVITYFLGGRYGLSKNTSIQETGEKIKALLRQFSL